MINEAPRELFDWEKAFLYDTLVKSAKWVQVGTDAGYWEIKIWDSKGRSFQNSIVKEHNAQHSRKEKEDD